MMVPRRITPRSPANTFNPLLFLVSAISEIIVYLKSIWLQTIYGRIANLDFHIEKKYDYFRDDITSTEEFIEYSATKSTMSGDFYMVSCPGKEAIRTQDWLMDELKRFRREKK